MSAFIALGKYGDIISILPILHHSHQQTGTAPKVLVSRRFAGVFDRVPNVEPVVYDGDWHDLNGALRVAKRQFGKVICLSVYGRDFPITHRCSSFQLEAYDRAGLLDKFGQLPMPSLARKAKVFKKPTILLADHAQNSPFPQKEDLYSALKLAFPEHDLVRLSHYRLPHLFDFLSWYDAAKALVCVDSAHLHLSAASTTPVAALTADKPSRWVGSAWSPRFVFHCRYGDYFARREELIERLQKAMNGVVIRQPLSLN